MTKVTSLPHIMTYPSKMGLDSDHQVSKGLTSIELIFSLSLISLIALFSLPLVQSACRLQEAFLRRETQIGIVSLAFQAIKQAVESTQVLSALPLFRIHPAGRITYADNSRYVVSRSTSAFNPSSQSDAISVLVPRPEILLSVVERTRFRASTATLEIVACFDAGQQSSQLLKSLEPLSQETSWLGLGISGFFEVSTQVHRLKGKVSSCRSGIPFSATMHLKRPAMFSSSAKNAFSGITFSPEQLLASIVALVPIAESYSLYVDQNGTLRRLSHLSNENQPIIKKLGQLHMVEENFSSSLGKLQVFISLKDPKTLELKEFSSALFLRMPSSQMLADVLL